MAHRKKVIPMRQSIFRRIWEKIRTEMWFLDAFLYHPRNNPTLLVMAAVLFAVSLGLKKFAGFDWRALGWRKFVVFGAAIY